MWIDSLPSLTLSCTVRSSISCSRSWSKYAIWRLVPKRTGRGGEELSQNQSQQGRLAGAVGTHQADLSPRMIVVENCRTIARSP